jgi:catechol 2,3-dioxygenase-like lactoylglutathione lyase family enzyme
MKSPLILGLRSVALTVPDLARAEAFYTNVWKLTVAARTPGVVYFRGSGADHHLLALHQAALPNLAPQIRQVTLRARSSEALSHIADATRSAAGTVERSLGASADPAGGQCIVIRDPHGRRFEVVFGDLRRSADEPAPADQPQRLAHAVLNSCLLYTSPSPRD